MVRRKRKDIYTVTKKKIYNIITVPTNNNLCQRKLDTTKKTRDKNKCIEIETFEKNSRKNSLEQDNE